MIRIKKFTLGIQPQQKMFRVSSLYGSIVDSVLSLRGVKPLEDEYYTEVSRTTEPFGFQLKSEERGNFLAMDLGNITFTKDLYNSQKQFDVDEALQEFRAVWKNVNDVLRVKDIRRIGVVIEHQIPMAGPSAALLKKLTAIPSDNHIAKFMLHFEERYRTSKKGGVPDTVRDDFINVHRDYYDSERDADHPKDGHLNANLDVQRYYSPLFNGNLFDEIALFRRYLTAEQTRFEQDLKQRGLV